MGKVESKEKENAGKFKVRKIGLIVGVVIFLILLMMPTPTGLSELGQKVLAVSVLMIIFWMTEAIPIPMTALLPILLYPIVGITGAKGQNEISLFTHYAYPTVYLVLGVSFLASAMQRWGLHRRMALWIVLKVGSKPSKIILGFILSTAVVSMWMSNTTATAMMLPVAASIIASMGNQVTDGFKKALVLSIPYAATLGGLATVIGTTTNPTGIGIIQQTLGIEINFMEWLKIGLPFTVVMLPVMWIYLRKFYKTDNMKEIEINTVKEEYKSLGPMNKGEKLTSVVFCVSVLLWVTRALWKDYIPFATDETIAIAIAISTMIIPVDYKNGVYLLEGKHALAEAPWGTMLLLGGSMVMGNAFTDAGVAEWIASNLGILSTMPEIVIIIAVGLVTAVLTEVTTNAVVVASFLPVLAGIAKGIGMDPLQLMLTCMIASNFAFMLPPATPPNAIAYSTGAVEVSDLMKAGFGLKLIGLIVFPIIMYFVTFGMFGVGI
ncbi:SLC13 family permease [Wansuia hejianensis]|uniref:Sodium-dependent dicarboxylate transporter SdcS n=1 Tax=Wansuia hejianensis TaxID=2763667 RepID=A0A926F1E3_9FIRM|nr:DASS family sodium-coupled anion symporter [Wansuia hejianensis]MBC8590124.1 DASS family sodium-coupled anion symporter [Wansuia hejianensis]